MENVYRFFWGVKKVIEKIYLGNRLIAQVEIGGPKRAEIINHLIQCRAYKRYLEIGVRNPADNFNHICCALKYSVDPGVEFFENPVDFKQTSDVFFEKNKEFISNTSFDVIFIDGLHRADQCWRDICHAEEVLAPGGCIIVHDVLPPSEDFARESFARSFEANTRWNGTTWKAFYKYQCEGKWSTYIVNSDWGVGIIDSFSTPTDRSLPNVFFEWDVFQDYVQSNKSDWTWERVRKRMGV
jgi:hypothetical protein